MIWNVFLPHTSLAPPPAHGIDTNDYNLEY